MACIAKTNGVYGVTARLVDAAGGCLLASAVARQNGRCSCDLLARYRSLAASIEFCRSNFGATQLANKVSITRLRRCRSHGAFWRQHPLSRWSALLPFFQYLSGDRPKQRQRCSFRAFRVVCPSDRQRGHFGSFASDVGSLPPRILTNKHQSISPGSNGARDITCGPSSVISTCSSSRTPPPPRIPSTQISGSTAKTMPG